MTSFGFGGSGFGSGQSSPFGGSTFGSSPAFGQASSSPFGSSTPGIFGNSTPAFGAQTPAFGATSAGFGSSTFGAKPSTGFGGFSASSSNPVFGSQPAFGATSSPAFGAPQSAPAFGGGFGATPSAPFGGGSNAFGAPSTPAFGFNSAPFGSSTGFGQTQPGFGMQQQQMGTKHIQYQKVADQEGTGNSKSNVYLCTIVAMQPLQPPNEKSFAELRWEDYQTGVKGNTGGNAFGQATPAPFGTPQPGGFGFQSAPAFGQSTSVFAQPQTSTFGFQSSPGFGSQPASIFGKATGSLFSPTSTPAFGNNAFGTTSFGTTASAFGNNNPFGQSSTPAFGQSGFSPGFGNAASSFTSSNPFGSTTTPQPFGQQNPATGFSFSNPASSAPFSFSNTFGQTNATNSFSSTQTTPGPFNFNNPASSSSIFGNSTSSLFGNKPAAGTAPSLFNPQSGGGLFSNPNNSFNFGQSGSLFGNQQSQSSNLFNFSQAGSQQTQSLTQLPGVGSSPYGVLPAAPNIGETGNSNIPEYRVGISRRPTGIMANRTMALIAPRSIAHHAGQYSSPLHRASVPRARTPRRFPSSSVDTLADVDNRTSSSSVSSPSIFVPRENPRQFFVRDSLPSTEILQSHARTPSFSHTPRGSTEDQANSNGDAEERKASERKASPASNGTSNGKKRASQPSASQQRPDGQGKLRGNKNGNNRGSEMDNDVGQKDPIIDDQAGTDQSLAPAHQLSDEEVSELLPTISDNSLHIEPSLTQLAAMARDDPESLESVANFRVAHRKYGSVLWKEPIDVRSLDLDSVVTFKPGCVDIYFEDENKPPMGEGLNKPAEITLLGVFKTDKVTGRPTTDSDAIAKFIQKLKLAAAKQHSRFIEYKPDKGIWRFQVDHFSRYGLVNMSDSDSDEEAMTSEQQIQGTDHLSGGQDFHSIPQEDDEMQEGDEVVVGPMNDSLAFDPDSTAAGLSPSNQRTAMSTDLALSLPASMNFQPVDLASVRESMFRGPHGKQSFGGFAGFSSGEVSPQRSGSRRRIAEGFFQPLRKDSLRPKVGIDALPETASQKLQDGAGSDPAKPSSLFHARPGASSIAQPVGPHTNTHWDPLTVPLQPPSALAPSSLEGASRSSLDSAASPCLVQFSADRSLQSRQMIEGGAFMGGSFRVGWGPNNKFFHPGGLRGSPGHPAVASHIASCAIVVDSATAHSNRKSDAVESQFWKALLQQHKDWSGQVENRLLGREIPQWALQCSRTEELGKLCAAFAAISTSQINDSETSAEKKALRTHEIHIWELLSILYSDIPHETVRNLEDAMEESADDGRDPDGLEQALDETQLTAAQRRASVSSWLRERAVPVMNTSLAEEGGKLEVIANLLAGHKVYDAASLAASQGNVRLATIILQASSSSKVRQDLSAQLACWQERGVTAKMDTVLSDIYGLLAGQPQAITKRLSLDWRRSFGLYLWYATAANAPIAGAMDSYLSAIEAEQAPMPIPPYAEETGWKIGQRRKFDLAFSLLQLFTGHLPEDSETELQELLSPENHLPQPMNAVFSWLLLQVLKAIGALKSTRAVLTQECMLASDVIAQLHTVGGLPEWEVYIAMNLPEHPDRPGLREQLVRHTLMRNAHCWADVPGCQDFIKALGFPQVWLLEAQTVNSHYRGNKDNELNYLLEAENWGAAHKLLVRELAAKWFLGTEEESAVLRRAINILEAHQEDIDADLGPNAYKAGAGLYAAYFSLLKEGIENTIEAMGSVAEQFAQQLAMAAEGLGNSDQDLRYSQVLSRMAENASNRLCLASHDSSLSCKLDALGMPSLPPDCRRLILHQSAMSIADILSI